MHEMSIAESIVEICLDTLKAHEGTIIHSVQVHVGMMSGIEPDALHFCFDAVTKNTAAQDAKLEITQIPVQATCVDCQHSFAVENYVFRCPQCDSGKVLAEHGSELKVVSIDMD